MNAKHIFSMKRNLLLINLFVVPLLIFGLPHTSCGQFTEGTIRYLITDNWVKKMNSVDYISKENRDRMSYVWGADAEWQEYGILTISGKQTKWEISDEVLDDEYAGYSWRKDEYELYRDYGNNTRFDINKTLGKLYVIEDSLRPQPWKILNDLKEVAGHVCMNARWTDTLRDQIVIAWFALDIPVSGGPDRYCGLPGMILEIDVNNGAKVYSANLIESKPTAELVRVPEKAKGKHIDGATLSAIEAKYIHERITAEEPWFWGGVRY